MKKSSRPKVGFLLDANISRSVIAHLSSLSFDALHISQVGKPSLPDEEVIKIAKKEQRVIITHDLDYGEIYYFKEQGQIGVIQLRLSDQTTRNTLLRLTEFLKDQKINLNNLRKSLVVISDKKTRVFTPETSRQIKL